MIFVTFLFVIDLVTFSLSKPLPFHHRTVTPSHDENVPNLTDLYSPPISNNDTHSGNASRLYNPFTYFHVESHKIYLMAVVYIMLFVLVKRLSELKFRYCCLSLYRNCGNKVCEKHVTSAGSIFPESAFLVIIGALPAFILYQWSFDLEKSLDPNFLFNILLIPIVFNAGWSVDKSVFYRNLGTILMFAIVGTILNATILAVLFYFGSSSRWGLFSINMDMLDSGLYSVLICAVDPVAVLSVFESMHIDRLLYNIVFGESLLNDGIAVVFYNAFKEMKAIPDVQFLESIGVIFLFFIYAFLTSVLLAILMAVVISFTTKWFYDNQSLQIVVLFTLNYFAYIAADCLKGSGILTLFFCVILQRQYVQANLTSFSQSIVSQILGQSSSLCEGVVFIMMGLTSFSSSGSEANTDIRFVVFLIVTCYISRFFVIYSLGTIANVFREQKLEYKKTLFIQAHGGLRGAIGFALALTLGDNVANKNYYQSATAIMVFFSVFILGTTIKPLVRFCKISIKKFKKKNCFESLQQKIGEEIEDGIKTIIGSESLKYRWERSYRIFNNKFLKKWLMNANALERNSSNSSVVKYFTEKTVDRAQKISSCQLPVTFVEEVCGNISNSISIRPFKIGGRNDHGNQGNVYTHISKEHEKGHCSVPM